MLTGVPKREKAAGAALSGWSFGTTGYVVFFLLVNHVAKTHGERTRAGVGDVVVRNVLERLNLADVGAKQVLSRELQAEVCREFLRKRHIQVGAGFLEHIRRGAFGNGQQAVAEDV